MNWRTMVKRMIAAAIRCRRFAAENPATRERMLGVSKGWLEAAKHVAYTAKLWEAAQ
jgi:hypothetical protein